VVDDGTREEAAAPQEPAPVPAPDDAPAAPQGAAPQSPETLAEAPQEPTAESTPEIPAGPPPPEPEPHPPGPEPRRSASFGSLAGAGLMGGLVGAGILYGLQTMFPPPVPEPVVQQDPQVAALRQQMGALARQDSVRALEARLGPLESGQSELDRKVQAAQEIAERGAARAEEALARPAAPAPPPAPAAAPPQDTAALDALANRLDGLEGEVRRQVEAGANAVRDVERRIASLEAQVRDQLQAGRGADEDLQRRLAGQEEQLTALNRQVAEGGSDATRAGTRLVLTERLGDALRDGAPYADILEALKGFGVDEARLAALQPYAAHGAPTAAALVRSFTPVGEQIVRDSRSGDSWSDRLLRMTDRVVSIRQIDQPGATDAAGLVARIEDALARGRFDDAAAAWDALPEPSRRLSEQWGKDLKQRAAAEAAARAVAVDAVAALRPATR
jgi:hypothetical protein